MPSASIDETGLGPECCPTCQRPWSTLDRILALHEQGVLAPDIAAQLGITRRRVNAVLQEAGVEQRRGRPPKQLPAEASIS